MGVFALGGTLMLALGLLLMAARSHAPTTEARLAGVSPHRLDDSGRMVPLAGGSFAMGFALGEADEQFVHRIEVAPFLLDKHDVTNRSFRKFVEQTGYVTQAERDRYCWAGLSPRNPYSSRMGRYGWLVPESLS
ncbi:MAG: formylglycine-generating enzyme family protein [Acidobacteria bacterium]|nr:formylglycine-generating enzyme family protein [Acidobacteriota bacterium]